MKNLGDLHDMPYDLEKMCMHAVDRSEGQLIDINIEYFGTIELLHYIADRSSKLRCLHLACLYGSVYEGLSEVLKKLPLLEELTLCFTDISKEDIEAAGRCCPLLKSLKINKQGVRYRDMDSDEEVQMEYNEEAVAIGKNLRELRHLQFIGNSMSNIGLQAIMDGCPHLESLDLRRCPNISLDGDLGKRCSEQIKYLRLPNDSMEDYKFDAEIYDSGLSDNNAFGFSDLDLYSDDDGYYGYSEYEDFTTYDDFTQNEDWNDCEKFIAMFGRF